MKEKSINFNEIEISKKEIDDLLEEYNTPSHKAWIPTTIRGLKVIKIVKKRRQTPKFENTVALIKAKYDDAKGKIKFDFTHPHYEEGIEWIEYDIKKQLYYFLTKEEFPVDYKYEPANPLIDERIQQEIVDRALGWSYWWNVMEESKVDWIDDSIIKEILYKYKYKSSFDFPDDRPYKDQELASWALAILGKRIRELSEGKNNSDIELEVTTIREYIKEFRQFNKKFNLSRSKYSNKFQKGLFYLEKGQKVVENLKKIQHSTAQSLSSVGVSRRGKASVKDMLEKTVEDIGVEKTIKWCELSQNLRERNPDFISTTILEQIELDNLEQDIEDILSDILQQRGEGNGENGNEEDIQDVVGDNEEVNLVEPENLIENRIRNLYERTTSPEGEIHFNTPSRTTAEQLEHERNAFQLRGGPADNASFHDFHQLQIAFENVWQEIFDNGVNKIASELYEKIVQLQHEYSGQGFEGDTLEELKSLITSASIENIEKARIELNVLLTNINPLPDGILDLLIITPEQWFDLRPHEKKKLLDLIEKLGGLKNDLNKINEDKEKSMSIWANMSLPESEKQRIKNEIEEKIKLRFNSVMAQVDMIKEDAEEVLDKSQQYVSSLEKLFLDLAERLNMPHRFDIFAPDAVNFGIVTTYRQEWQPLNYQVGNLVDTIPLAPKEVRKVSKKTTISKKRAKKEQENALQILKSDSNVTGRVESEIVKNAAKNTNFNTSFSAGMQIKLANVSNTTGVTLDASNSSNTVKKDFREAVKKAAQEYKNERKTEVSFEESFSSDATYSGEISNPNDEITVTYLFYELQRRYRIREKIQKVTPVILVANNVPSPDQIDEEWLMGYEWILRRVILDDSFLEPFDYVREGFVADELNLKTTQITFEHQRQIVEDVSGNVEGLTNLHSELQSLLNETSQGEKIANFEKKKRRKKKIFGAIGGGVASGAVAVNPVAGATLGALALGNDDGNGASPEMLKIQKEAYEARLNQTKEALAVAREELANETRALEKAKSDYMQMVKIVYTKRNIVAQLKIHIKENVMYYMQAIWNHEPPDQRYFRLYNVEVPWISCTGEEIDCMLEAKFQKANRVVDRLNPGSATYEVDYTINYEHLKDKEIPIRKLHQVADLDNLLGYKGNYMIFPLKEDSLWTCFMKKPYESLTNDGILLTDPDEMANYSLDEIKGLIRSHSSRDAEKNADDAERIAITKEHYRALLKQWFKSNGAEQQEIVVPTSSLYIEALPGVHPILEDFKLAHRALDVKKVQAEIREAELENLRRAGRLIEEDYEYPNEERKVVENGDMNVRLDLDWNQDEVNG